MTIGDPRGGWVGHYHHCHRAPAAVHRAVCGAAVRRASLYGKLSHCVLGCV
jgi:hypothetical protein